MGVAATTMLTGLRAVPDRFILTTVGLQLNETRSTQSKLLHKYLPPVDVEIVAESLDTR